ncbi:FAD-dependent oxidoreductase [Sciscionella marina]|uniref:FAD-dependent oxidoreductase n=1 Tax=Sciscionella marina TaxID=508770 RepID=UPI000362BAF8|nr:FAD-dependent oxidoreductase [Sciscionella marina]
MANADERKTGGDSERSISSRRSMLKAAGAAGLGVLLASASGVPASAAAANGRRVAVFGAGPGGMSVAHELAERGFQVDVYDRFSRLGGGVRSYTTPGAGTAGRPALPNTSGGHFFLPGYAAMPDLLSRIPTGDGRKVIDRLAFSSQGMLGGRIGANGALIALGIPTSLDRIGEFDPAHIAQTIQGTLQLLGGFRPSDIPHLASKIAAWVTSGTLRRENQLEYIDLEYGFFRSELLSPTAHTLIRDLATTVSVDSPTRGINSLVYLTAIIDQIINMLAGRRRYPKSPEKVLDILTDGPETEVWFDPWARYLRGLGTRFHLRRTLTRIGVENGRIAGADVMDERGRTERVEADWYVLAMPPDRMRPLLSRDLLAADPGLANVRKLDPAVESGFEIFFRDPVGFELGQVTNRNGDEQWLLTLVGLSEIWGIDLREFGDGQAKGMLSVEFNNHPYFDTPGILYGKPLKDLNYAQAFDEIRAHIERGIPDGKALLAKDNLLGWRPHPTLSWTGQSGWTVPDHRTASAPGTSKYFPDQVRRIPNLFLAGGSTKTAIGGDNMDSAALSAKLATNWIIEAAGVREPHAELPYYGPPPELEAARRDDDRRFRAGLPHAFDLVAPARMPPPHG